MDDTSSEDEDAPVIAKENEEKTDDALDKTSTKDGDTRSDVKKRLKKVKAFQYIEEGWDESFAKKSVKSLRSMVKLEAEKALKNKQGNEDKGKQS